MRPLLNYVNVAHHTRKLAVELASRFNGEIINGDAMQLYHGLPIITNKVTQEEMRGIPHHLLGCIGFEQETWTVFHFVKEALRIVGLELPARLGKGLILGRLMRYGIEEICQYLLGELITIHNRSYFKVPLQMSLQEPRLKRIRNLQS